ncbi:MAG: adenosylcobalamin-dependent ribonucleoside-diphosphate reductase [Bacteroidales bacterium]|nr:adenosylcobalamin-dependent ribonucleoside-diphosphate reductase [Bacteroidales bacterium]
MDLNKNKYSYQEAYDSTLEYFKGDTLATEVWLNKYALKDEKGSFYEKTPEDMFDRLAREFYDIEKTYPSPYSYEDIRNAFNDSEHKIRIIPGGSVLAGLGDPNYIGSLSNCLVIDSPQDSYHGIMKSREERVQLMKRRCGVGVDISSLRPAGASVNNPAKSSTGPVSFMDVDSGLTNEVAQSGRRGALMITISCVHPDVLDFIKKKQDLTKVTGANISVQLTNDFMEAVKNDSDFILHWPVDIHIRPEEYKDLEYGKLEIFEIQCGKVYVRRIKAKDYWNELIHCAWNTGEPGIMFHDTHIDYSPEGKYNKYRGITTNPCGEIFMEKYDSCRLISLNLSSFVEKPFTSEAAFNYEEFAKAVRLGLHISDDLVDAEIKCIDRIIENIDTNSTVELNLWKTIRETGQQGRRCGLGITALGDMVAMMGFKFDSPEAFDFIEKVMSVKYRSEVETEVDMANERGVFYGFDSNLEKSGKFSDRLKENVGEELWKKYVEGGRRNVSWNTIAPTGSLSILTQTTSGIEPIFSAYYTRRKKCTEGDRVDFVDKTGQKFTEYLVVHPQLKKWFKINGEKVTSELGIEYFEDVSNYKLEDMDKIFKCSPWYMSTANDIDWRKRTALQGMIQKYITHSISSTVNLPNTAIEQDVAEIYMDAYDNCLKGITVYRDGCRDGVLVTANKNCDCNKQSLIHDAPKRPKVLPCDIMRFRNNKEKWVAAVGLYDGQPYEIFTGLVEKLDIPDYVEKGEIIKNKINETYIDEITGEESIRKVSRYDLRYVNKNGEEIVVESINTVFNKEFWNYGKLIAGILRHGMRIEYIINIVKNLTFTNDSINSWKNGVARILKTYCADGEVKGEVCPECGAKIIRENGCKHCSNCTWSACQ